MKGEPVVYGSPFYYFCVSCLGENYDWFTSYHWNESHYLFFQKDLISKNKMLTISSFKW